MPDTLLTDSQKLEQTLQALASIEKGHVVPANIVHAWLESWGSENELPAPTVSFANK